MRVLRSAIYVSITEPPVVTVMLDCDVTDTLESARQRLITPGAFLAFEVFEMPDDTDLEAAMLEALRRITPDIQLREANQALSYHWNGRHLRMVQANGVLFNDKPAPLTAEECGAVLAQLARHPNYKPGIAITQTAEDGEHVTLSDGKVTYERTEES